MQRYRRAVGWLVVALSFGMAFYALAEMSGWEWDVSDNLFTAVGVGAALVIILLLAKGRASAGRKRVLSDPPT
jgi:high-affinity nickel-transport protein